MEALAAEAAAGHGESFFASAEFWVLVAFVLFVGGVAKPVYRTIVTALDDRAEKIKRQIEDATRLREEAQELLASYERKQRDAVKEAEQIVEHARRDAERLGRKAADDLERALRRREQLAMDRIAQAEAAAIDEVRSTAVDVAVEATRRLLADTVTGKRADALIDRAVKDLPDKLH